MTIRAMSFVPPTAEALGGSGAAAEPQARPRGARLREYPPFGEPDTGDPNVRAGQQDDLARTDDPRGVYLPAPESTPPASCRSLPSPAKPA